jgi:hypothetical protein
MGPLRRDGKRRVSLHEMGDLMNELRQVPAARDILARARSTAAVTEHDYYEADLYIAALKEAGLHIAPLPDTGTDAEAGDTDCPAGRFERRSR